MSEAGLETRPDADDEESPIEMLETRPVNAGEDKLREKFAERKAAQSESMNALARQLITVELAIPGIYAAVLKLAQGDKATVNVDIWFYLTFGSWLLALALTLFSLIPRDWQVNEAMLKPDPAGRSTELSIEEFFYKSAQFKRRLLIPAIVLFWIGIFCAVFIIL